MDEWESESEGGNWSLPVHSKHPSEQVSQDRSLEDHPRTESVKRRKHLEG